MYVLSSVHLPSSVPCSFFAVYLRKSSAFILVVDVKIMQIYEIISVMLNLVMHILIQIVFYLYVYVSLCVCNLFIIYARVIIFFILTSSMTFAVIVLFTHFLFLN